MRSVRQKIGSQRRRDAETRCFGRLRRRVLAGDSRRPFADDSHSAVADHSRGTFDCLRELNTKTQRHRDQTGRGTRGKTLDRSFFSSSVSSFSSPSSSGLCVSVSLCSIHLASPYAARANGAFSPDARDASLRSPLCVSASLRQLLPAHECATGDAIYAAFRPTEQEAC
jgi:hypothetical protein